MSVEEDGEGIEIAGLSEEMASSPPEIVHLLERILQELEAIEGSDEGTELSVVDPADDISSGVEVDLSSLSDDTPFTVYFYDIEDAIDINMRLSPDGGDTVVEIPESPIEYDGTEEEDAIFVQYNANWIELEGSNSNDIGVKIRG